MLLCYICWKLYRYLGEFLASQAILDLYHIPYLLLGVVIFPQISNGLPNILSVLFHDWAQHGYQHPKPGPGGINRSILAISPAVTVS